MAKLGLNLDQFKKIKSDKNTTVLRHAKDGHEIKLAHGALKPEMKSALEKLPLHKYAEGSPEGVSEDDNALTTKDSPVSRPETKYTGNSTGLEYGPETDAQTEVTPVPDQQSVATTQSSPEIPTNTDVSNAQTLPSDPYGLDQYAQQKQNALNESEMGAIGQNQAGQAYAGQMGKLSNQYAQSVADQMARYKDAQNNIQAERSNLQSDIMNQHIDPKAYMKNMSTGGKIGTIFGLLVGGMGAGLTHGTNLAWQGMQDNINRDIQSQRDELGKKQNLLAHNFQKEGNLNVATDLTRIQTNDVLSAHAKALAAQSQSAAAKAGLLGIAGNFDNQSAELTHNIAVQKAMYQYGGGLEMLPADKRERAVRLPDGRIQLAITKDGAKDLREQIQTTQPIFDQLDKLGQLGPSALVPGTPANQTAQSVRAQLIPMVNENAGLKRLSGEDIQNINKMFSDPTRFSQLLGGQAKTNAFKGFLQDKLMSTMSNQLENYTPQRAQQSQQMPQTMTKGGVKYNKVPGGWKKAM